MNRRENWVGIAAVLLGLAGALWWTLAEPLGAGDSGGMTGDGRRPKAESVDEGNGTMETKSKRRTRERLGLEDHLGEGGRVLPPHGDGRNWTVVFGDGKPTVIAARVTVTDESLIFGGPFSVRLEGSEHAGKEMLGSDQADVELHVSENGSKLRSSGAIHSGRSIEVAEE